MITLFQAKLIDGTPFVPLARRMLLLESDGSSLRSDLLADIAIAESPTVKSAAPEDAQLSLHVERVYEVVYLGKTEVNEVETSSVL